MSRPPITVYAQEHIVAPVPGIKRGTTGLKRSILSPHIDSFLALSLPLSLSNCLLSSQDSEGEEEEGNNSQEEPVEAEARRTSPRKRRSRKD